MTNSQGAEGGRRERPGSIQFAMHRGGLAGGGGPTGRSRMGRRSGTRSGDWRIHSEALLAADADFGGISGVARDTHRPARGGGVRPGGTAAAAAPLRAATPLADGGVGRGVPAGGPGFIGLAVRVDVRALAAASLGGIAAAVDRPVGKVQGRALRTDYRPARADRGVAATDLIIRELRRPIGRTYLV